MTEARRLQRNGSHNKRLVKRRLEPICYYCKNRVGKYSMTADHLIPLSRGGTNRIENLVISCKRCNNEKGSMTLEEYLQYKKNNISLVVPVRRKENNPIIEIIPEYKEIVFEGMVNINDIKIPRIFQQQTPKEKTINKPLKYFLAYRCLDEPITIHATKRNLLIDGYARYLIAQEYGIEEVPVVYKEVKSKMF
jgi:predicted GTPase